MSNCSAMHLVNSMQLHVPAALCETVKHVSDHLRYYFACNTVLQHIHTALQCCCSATRDPSPPQGRAQDRDEGQGQGGDGLHSGEQRSLEDSTPS